VLASSVLSAPSIDPIDPIVIGVDLSDGGGNERAPSSVCIDKPLDWRGADREWREAGFVAWCALAD
jgi:histidine ammonia-lyase